jgi:Raf kinase inhibitor-like YbhB/YbcL family protein
MSTACGGAALAKLPGSGQSGAVPLSPKREAVAMSKEVPAWLSEAIADARSGHAGLAVASLGSSSLLGRGGFSLSSPAFLDGGMLDPCFTADEDDAVAPPLEWTAPPPGTQELALIVEDPDAPGVEPFCHWLVWGLSPQAGKLLEGEVPPRVGKNAHQNSEWLLPNPPEGDRAHDYVFQLFALDRPLGLMPGAGRNDLIAAMEGHVIAAAVTTGKYQRQEDGDEWGGDWDDTDEID